MTLRSQLPKLIGTTQVFTVIGITSVVLGAYFRFVGLGLAPLTNDEFYLVVAVERIIELGLPEFRCGGLYLRGILQQLFMLPLMALNVNVETAVRVLPALSYLAALPALYKLSKHATNSNVAIIVCCIFSLSLWEIEISRFGRMYMPFQAFFLWYLVVLQTAWLQPTKWRVQIVLNLLALISVLLWEGGIFAGMLCFLPVLARKSFDRRTLLHLASVVLVLATTYFFLTYNFRNPGGSDASWPIELLQTSANEAYGAFGAIFRPIVFLANSAVPNTLSLAFLGLLPVACFYVWFRTYRGAPTWAGNVLVLILLVLSIANQATLVGAGFIIGLALGLLRFDSRQGLRSLVYAVLALHIVAIAFSIYFVDWIPQLAEADYGPVGNEIINRIGESRGLRDQTLLTIFAIFAYPFGAATFIWSWFSVLGLFIAAIGFFAAVGLLRSFLVTSTHSTSYRFLSAVLILVILSSTVILIVGQSRYWFFFYPLLLLLGIGGVSYIAEVLDTSDRKRGAAYATLAVAAILFLPSSDFSWSHLTRINEPEVRTRAIYGNEFTSHLIMRRDYRTAANELAKRASPNDTIVSTKLTIGYYLHQLDYVYFGPEHSQFANYTACQGEKVRWVDKPLLFRPSQLQRVLEESKGNVWLITSIRSSRPDEALIAGPLKSKEVWRSIDQELSLLKLSASDSQLLQSDELRIPSKL